MTASAWKGLAFGIGIGAITVGAATFMNTPKLSAERETIPPAANVATVDPSAPTITVYKTATCGCCKLWVDYLRENGYTVVAKDISDAELASFNREHGVPGALESCHTALVNGYVLEGHVPVEDIKRLLAERPPIAGLALPGMVSGSPGMPGVTDAHYSIIAFDKRGGSKVYSSK